MTKSLTSLVIVCVCVCVCVCMYAQSCLTFAVPWTITHQAPLSTGLFNRRLQIKPSMIPLHTHYEWYSSKSQKQKAKHVIKDVEKLVSSSIGDGNGTGDRHIFQFFNRNSGGVRFVLNEGAHASAFFSNYLIPGRIRVLHKKSSLSVFSIIA